MGGLTQGFDGLCFERPERDGSTNPRLSMRNLTQTFHGLILIAHRANC